MTAPATSSRHATAFVVLDRWRIVLALIVVAVVAACVAASAVFERTRPLWRDALMRRL
jgi:hypothetical protein